MLYNFDIIFACYVTYFYAFIGSNSDLMHPFLLYKNYSEPTNIEEEEVCKMIRECLDLRKKYVYKEKVVPWKTEPVETIFDPFHFEPVEATAVS